MTPPVDVVWIPDLSRLLPVCHLIPANQSLPGCVDTYVAVAVLSVSEHEYFKVKCVLFVLVTCDLIKTLFPSHT